MSDKDEQTTTGAVATFAGSAFKKRKKKKKKSRKTPLALAYTGIGTPTGFENAVIAAVNEWIEKRACKTPGLKIRSKGKGRGFARGKGRGPIGVPVGAK